MHRRFSFFIFVTPSIALLFPRDLSIRVLPAITCTAHEHDPNVVCFSPGCSFCCEDNRFGLCQENALMLYGQCLDGLVCTPQVNYFAPCRLPSDPGPGPGPNSDGNC